MERRYRSQREYGRYGGLICTPVCCLVTIAHVKYELSPSDFDAAIHQAMVEGHAMVSRSETMQPMMLQDLTDTFKASGVEISEAAGLTHTGEIEQVESLLICPLKLLLKELKLGKMEGLIVTCLGHTVCYLLSRDGCVLLFDPLPAKLKDVTTTWRETLPTGNVEYSAIIASYASQANLHTLH